MEKEIIFNKLNEATGTSLVYGDWGIGKTHLIKEYLEDVTFKGTNKNIYLYIDARMFDQNKDMFDFIACFLVDYKTEKNIFKNFADGVGRVMTNWMISGANVFKTNIEYKKVFRDVDLELEINQIPKNAIFNLFIDELDRVTPQTILKCLNFINGLSIMRENMKIYAIANKDELNSILKKHFGYSDDSDFTHKYFKNELNLGSISRESLLEVSNSDFLKSLIKDGLLTSNARTLERQIERAQFLHKKFNFLSIDIIYYSLLKVGDGLESHEVFNGGDLYINGDFVHRVDFSFKCKDGRSGTLNTMTGYYNGNRLSLSKDLFFNYGFDNFEAWVVKYFKDGILI